MPKKRSEYDRAYYAAHRDKRRAQNLANYHNAPELCGARRRCWQNANRAAINLSAKTGLPVAVCRRALDAAQPL